MKSNPHLVKTIAAAILLIAGNSTVLAQTCMGVTKFFPELREDADFAKQAGSSGIFQPMRTYGTGLQVKGVCGENGTDTLKALGVKVFGTLTDGIEPVMYVAPFGKNGKHEFVQTSQDDPRGHKWDPKALAVFLPPSLTNAAGFGPEATASWGVRGKPVIDSENGRFEYTVFVHSYVKNPNGPRTWLCALVRGDKTSAEWVARTDPNFVYTDNPSREAASKKCLPEYVLSK